MYYLITYNVNRPYDHTQDVIINTNTVNGSLVTHMDTLLYREFNKSKLSPLTS